MRHQRYFFLLFFYAACVFSQQHTTDSLRLVLRKTKSDMERVIVLNALADAYKNTDPEKLVSYATQAMETARRIHFKMAEGQAYLNLGNGHILSGDYMRALENFTQAQQIFEEETTTAATNGSEIKKGLAKAYGSIGIVFSEQSNYAKALQFYLKSVKIYEGLHDEAHCATLYNNIGIVYRSQKSDFKALQYFTKAQEIQVRLGDPNIGVTLTNIANCYLRQQDYGKALQYYTQARQSFDRHPNPRALGEWYNNMGLYHKATGQFDQAKTQWNQAIATFESIGDQFGIADTYLYLGELYLQQHQWEAALLSANKALGLARQLGVLEQAVVAEKLLSDIYDKTGKPAQALKHYRLYAQAKDSLENSESIRKSLEEEINFEFEKREALQKKELEKKELLLGEQAKRNTLQLVFAVLFALLAAGIVFLIYNRKQLKKTLTLEKELAEYEQKALHLQMNPHFVFNCLGSISSFILQNGTDSALKYLSKFSKLMRLTLEYSKEPLIPIDREMESLQNYLELEQLRFNQKFDFTITKSNDIEDDTALPPLLLQPFVENSIIHGLIPKNDKGKISIHFSLDGESLRCTIKDNGIGFDQSKALKEPLVSLHKSMALDITKKRLEMMGASTSQKAKVKIEELKGEGGQILGTQVSLTLPIQYLQPTAP